MSKRIEEFEIKKVLCDVEEIIKNLAERAEVANEMEATLRGNFVYRSTYGIQLDEKDRCLSGSELLIKCLTLLNEKKERKNA